MAVDDRAFQHTEPVAGVLPMLARRSLGGRLVLASLLFCAAFILVSVGVLTVLAWNAGIARMEAELAQIEQIYGHTLSKAIWELDRDALQMQVQSAKGIPSVGKIVVRVALASMTR